MNSSKDDPHLTNYIEFFSAQIGRPEPETIAAKFLAEAIRRYGQFARTGWRQMRYYTWMASDRAARALEKEGATRTSRFAPRTAAFSTRGQKP
jgi:hypothetical protein